MAKNVAGLLMAHTSKYVGMALDSMAKFCDLGIWVNCNDISDESREIVSRHPAVKKTIFTENEVRWNQGLQRDTTLRMLDDVKPELVLWPDDDEVYYTGFGEDLDRFASSPEYLTFWIRLLYLWNGIEQSREDGLYGKIGKVTAFKWRPGLSYNPYPGYTCPAQYLKEPKETRFKGSKPLPHFGYMHEDVREEKEKRSSASKKRDDHNSITKKTPEGIIPEEVWIELQ
jgi:hypothetical protein